MAEVSSPALVGRRGALALLFLVAAAALWTSFFTTSRFEKRDAYDYAQLGRQIRSHQGFTTRQIFPRYIPYLADRGYLHAEEWPSVHRAHPAMPLASAGVQLVIADPIEASVVATGVFFVLSVPLLFLLAARLTDIKVASLATLVFITDPRLVRAAFDGMTESLAILLTLLLAHAVFRSATFAGRPESWVLIGFLCGLIYLARTQLIFLLPLVMLLALVTLKEHRIRSLLLLLAAMAITISPWVARNYAVVGSPSLTLYNSRALLAKTDSFHRVDLELHAPTDIGDVLRLAGDEIAAKFGRNLWPNIVDPSFWWQVLGIYAICFPVVAITCLIGRREDLYRRFEISVMVLCLANFLTICTTYHRPRYYETLIPFLIVVLSRGIGSLIEMGLAKRAPAARPLMAAVAWTALVLLAGWQGWATFSDHASQAGHSPHRDPSYEELAAMTRPDDVIASDLSLEITVYNGSRTVRLPADPDDILEIHRDYLPLDWLVISADVAGRDHLDRFMRSVPFQNQYRLAARLTNRAFVFRSRADTEAPG